MILCLKASILIKECFFVYMMKNSYIYSQTFCTLTYCSILSAMQQDNATTNYCGLIELPQPAKESGDLRTLQYYPCFRYLLK